MRMNFSVARHARKKKVLKRASGYYGDKSRRLRMATQQLDHSGVHAYVDRKDKKTTYRQMWITRINAACKLNGMNYSTFVNGLKKSGIVINRKMLAELAVNNKEAFAQLAETAKKALA